MDLHIVSQSEKEVAEMDTAFYPHLITGNHLCLARTHTRACAELIVAALELSEMLEKKFGRCRFE